MVAWLDELFVETCTVSSFTTTTNMSAVDEDAERRQREINMFAAFAAGDGVVLDGMPMGTFLDSKDLTPSEGDNVDDAMQQLFAATGSQVEDSGTFAMASSPHAHATAERSNLEAAVAALTAGHSDTQQPEVKWKPKLPLHYPRRSPRRLQMTNTTPIYTEEVWLPRPLFFGPIVPPRVLKQARKIVFDALQYQGWDGRDETLPPKSSLPPDVRNLISAIDTFGFGLSVFPPSNNIESINEKVWRGTEYVTTYQPVFGDLARAERQERRKRRRSRSSKRSRSGSSTLSIPLTGEDIIDSERGNPDSPDRSILVETDAASTVPDRDMFSMWAQEGNKMSSSLNSTASVILTKKQHVSRQLPTEKTVVKDDESDGNIDEAPKPLSEKDLFSRWARGEPTIGRAAIANPMGNSQDSAADSVPFFDSDTFLPLHHRSKEDNDSDSVVGSELKKKVGISEHLHAALASLAADVHASNSDATVSGSLTGDESEALLAQLPVATLGGRPLSNFELTNGCVPLFGADDAPLPCEADLGIYETKEEQIRSTQQRRSQEIIDKFVSPSVFGSVACPNPALNPDDNHSWNSRAATSPRLLDAVAKRVSANRNGSTSMSQGLTDASAREANDTGMNPESSNPSGQGTPSMRQGPVSGSRKNESPSLRDGKRRYGSISRVGWWNVSDTDNDSAATADTDGNDDAREALGETPLQLPPIEHGSYAPHVDTGLRPTPKKLREENLPLSLLHSATSTAEVLPFLSDRPPSYRYVQIDARAVGFPPLAGEIEPLFCSLSIYHVETDGTSNPAPNMQKCGRITETLNFDVVSDPEVEQRCSGSLWPYAVVPGEAKDDTSFSRGAVDDATYLSSLPHNERTQCSRCGVFPIPSNFNVANLYAILVVQKVLASESDIDIYLKAGKGSEGEETELQSDDIPNAKAKVLVDLEKYKAKAEKASSRRSHFLVPFAFGVAPLLQVFGADSPTTACSRAVQIPLFRFFAGSGDRQIIDHIMVMLFPRYVCVLFILSCMSLTYSVSLGDSQSRI